ncbi:lysozyme inhibitor LprI family protein [Spongorhabdus nitratireducens]
MKKFSGLIVGLLALQVSAAELDCENASSTIEINQCAAAELGKIEKEMQRYLQQSLEQSKDDEVLVKAIKESQQSWLEYRKSYCDAVYTRWRDGTIRTLMALDCEKRLTRQRTHELWSEFLTYMDSTKPVLPEPKQ